MQHSGEVDTNVNDGTRRSAAGAGSPGRRNTPKNRSGQQAPFERAKQRKPMPYQAGGARRAGSPGKPGQRMGGGGGFGGAGQQQRRGDAQDAGPAEDGAEDGGHSMAAFGWNHQARAAPGTQASHRSATGSERSVGSSYRSTYSQGTHKNGARMAQGSGYGGPSRANEGGVGDRTPPGRRPGGGGAQGSGGNGAASARERRRRPGQVDPGERLVTTSPNGEPASPVERPPPGTRTEGTVRFADGSLYTGELLDGIQDGQGSYRSAVGTFYEGHWARGKRNGHGTEKYPIGNTYEGTWLDDQKHGQGIVCAAAPQAPSMAPPRVPVEWTRCA